MIRLRDANRNESYVQEGESANITATFSFAGVQFLKAGLLSLTLTLYDEASATIINDRDDQDVLDDNGGAVNTDGTLTLELDADDNTIVGAAVAARAMETHIARLKWTWNDGDSVRTGIEELSFKVEKLLVLT